MSKAPVNLLFAPFVIEMPLNSQAGPMTRRYVNDSCAIAVGSLLSSNDSPRFNGLADFS
jgi:hypothetical protein